MLLQVYGQPFGSIVGFKSLSDMILLSIANKVLSTSSNSLPLTLLQIGGHLQMPLSMNSGRNSSKLANNNPREGRIQDF